MHWWVWVLIVVAAALLVFGFDWWLCSDPGVEAEWAKERFREEQEVERDRDRLRAKREVEMTTDPSRAKQD